MNCAGGRKRQYSASLDHYPESSRCQENDAQPDGCKATYDQSGSFSSYSRPCSPFLAAAPSPLHGRPKDKDMGDVPSSENNDVEVEPSTNAEHPNSFNRETMMDQYITLKAREEELDGRISDMATERTSIADQIAEVQANINTTYDRQWDLEEEAADPVRRRRAS